MITPSPEQQSDTETLRQIQGALEGGISELFLYFILRR